MAHVYDDFTELRPGGDPRGDHGEDGRRENSCERPWERAARPLGMVTGT
ncbi:hypothetical protein BQ8420_00130 [Nocardiopsis sp. JB363]|nr:hypothetical protein BQ8420_00130 [Nocardiopsis sp. JB363]